jgi:HPt (histidine-containing phosphotransfer) domain-containing protein
MNEDQNITGIFDRAAMLERLIHDEDLVNAVLERFLSDTPERIAALEDALTQRDAARIRIHAHTLKSAAANINAAALRETALAMETAAESGELETLYELMPIIRKQFGILIKILASQEEPVTGADGT